MARDSLDRALDLVPNEQRRLLVRMMELGLVNTISSNDKTGRGVVYYTPKGLKFIKLVEAIVFSTEPSLRQARLIALTALSLNWHVWAACKK